MKKYLKTCLAILFSIVLVMNSVSVSALVSDNDNEQEMQTVENEEYYKEIQSEDSEDSEDVQAIDVENSSKSGGEAGETEETLSEETGQETTKQEDAEDVITTEEIRTEENAVEETAVETTAVETTSEAITEESEESVNMPEFAGLKIVDGVVIMVTAPEGVFPEESTLLVNKVSNEEQQNVDNAVDKTRNNNVNVAASYTYDIKVLNKDGEEIQPVDEQKVKVIFTLAEAENENLTADIYHITGENGDLSAEALDTTGQGAVVMAESDGFSYYTVEFTYNEKQYVMEGDSTVALTDILSFVGITKEDGSAVADSDITAIRVSDESLFSSANESGEWMVTSHQAFHTDEWLKVTVDGVEYEIVVTDAEYSNVDIYANELQKDDIIRKNVKIKDPAGASIHVYLDDKLVVELTGVNDSWTVPQDCKVIETEGVWSYHDGTIKLSSLSVDPTYTAPTSKTMTYNGSAQALVNSGSVSSGGSMEYAIGTSSTTAPTSGWSTAVPTETNVGTYYVWYRINATSGYNAVAAKCVTSTISKAANPITYANQTWNYTFSSTGQTKTLAQATNNQGSVTYALQSQKRDTTNVNYFSFAPTTRALTANANTPAGTYSVVVRATAAGNNNYNSGYKDSTITVTVGKATMTDVSATGYTGIYDASGHSITVTAPDGATVKYRTTGSGDYNLTTAPTYTDVGIYTVYYQITKANYETVTGSKTVQINPIELTLTWGDETSFTYNGSPQVPTATISGVINGDDCTVSVNGAKTDYSASPYTATAVLNGAKKGNYKLPTENTKPFTISKKAATITAKDQTVTYGTSIASDTAHVTTEGFVDGEALTAITLTPSTSDVTTAGTITPSVAVIKNGDTDVTNNYDITFNTGNLTINKKPITISGITASNKTYDGTTTATLNYNGINWTECGMVAGDDLSVTATGTFSDANVGTGKTVTITGLTLGGTKSGNYELAESGQQTSTTADINAKAITITAGSDSNVYDGTAHTKDIYSITSGELVTDDSIESVTVTGSQTFVGESANVPDAAVIKNSLGAEVTGNYDITYVNGTLTVTKKPLTITADSAEKVYDTTPLTTDRYTYTELAEGDSISSVTVTGSRTSVGESYNVPRDAVIKKGEVDVTENYLITYVNGVLKVTKKTVTITANSDTKIYDGTALTNDNYTVSGLENDDKVDSVTITGTQTIVGESENVPSAAVIKNAANEDVNENYSISYNNGILKVTKKPITITANSDSKVYDGTALAKDSYTSTALADGDRIDYVTVTGTQTVAGESANVPSAAVIKNANGDDVTASYDIKYENGTLKVTKKAVTITADNATKVYDGMPLTKESYTNSELASGDSIESVTVTGSQTSAGQSANVPSRAVIKNANGDDVSASYDITYVEGTLEVTKKAVTITADDATKVYDGTPLTKNSYTNSELADGDKIESVLITGSQTVVGESASVPSEAVIKNANGEDVTASYDITYVEGTLEVTKKTVTITADDATKVYDGTPLTKNSYTNSKLADGDVIESVLITGSQTVVGESASVPSAAVIKNAEGEDVTASYDITYVEGTLEVTKKTVTITADDATKIYDGTALTKDSYTNSNLATGDRIESVTITGSQTVVGESANVPSEAVIKNASNEDVTASYDITYERGTLKVTKKAVTITADDATKVYDGTPLTKNSYTNSVLADGDRIESVAIAGSQTVVGESVNVPSEAVIKNASGDDVTASYDITYVNGKLEVMKKAVTITADSDSKVYDGTALTNGGFTSTEIAEDDDIESVIVTGSQTDVGQSVNVPSEAVIKNASGEDVTASYDITYVDGTLEVTKKPVTIDGITAKDKTYDGTTDAELDYSDIDWSACGMVDGDELSVTATGTFDDSNAGAGKNVTITDITLDGESIDNYVLADAGQQTTAVATINKKAVTVTALKQTVAVNGEIENSIKYAVLSGALEGHELAEITLTSGSTAKTTTEGVITPSEAKIVNGDTDVTDNYDISYIDGIMTVTKAEAEVVLDNGDDEAPASVTAVEVPNLLELADEEAEEGKLVKVELSVKPVSENNVSSTTVSDVKKAVESLFAFVDMESVKVEYLEIDLTKYVDNVKESAISDTGAPLEIILTYDTSKAGNPVIIRNHEGTVTVFTQLSSRPTGNLTDATYYVEGNKIYMYSQYFSDFAIAYSVEKTFNVILDDGNGNIIRQIVSEGTKFIPPTDITKDGYNLDGWYKDETFTEKWNTEKDKVASDIKLFAKWTKKAEPAKVETPKADTPKAPATGDKMNIGVIVILMIGSALAALYLTLRRRLMK